MANPGSHVASKHADEPGVGAYLPAAQYKQAEAPDDDEYLPARQSWQSVRPAPANFPGGQSEQVDASTDGTAYRPAAQAEQRPWPPVEYSPSEQDWHFSWVNALLLQY